MSHSSGDSVGRGFYWCPVSGEHIDVVEDKMKILPGTNSTFYKTNPFLMIFMAPIIGLAFVVFLPVIGIILTIYHLSEKAISMMPKIVTHPAMIGEAALTEKRTKEDEDVEAFKMNANELTRTSEEIAERRKAGEK
jgi:hypothetical protein